MPGTNVALNHAFVSAKSDGPDTTLVRPSNWNANVKLTGGSGGHRLIRDPSQTDGGAWVEPATVRLTNRTGGVHTVGDVVVVDSANDSSVAASSTASSLKKALVAMEANANAAAGIYAAEGPVSAKATGAIARHQYVRLSATTGSIEDAGAAMTTGVPAPLGAVGVALAAAAGGFCTIYLFAFTVGGPPVTAGYLKGTGTGYSTQNTPLPVADLGSGTPAAGKYVDGGTGAWTTLPTPVLDKNGAGVTVANTTTETALVSSSIPGNTIGANGRLRVTLIGTITDTSAADTTMTFRFKYGATTLASLVTTTGSTASAASIGSGLPFKLVFELANLNATNSQRGNAEVLSQTLRVDATPTAVLSASGAGVAATLLHQLLTGTSAEDSTAAKTLAVTAQWQFASATRSITMSHYSIEVVA